ncbi:MAG TPA: alpha/beta hydrolase [Candidatus Obscuribacterales bacterium]
MPATYLTLILAMRTPLYDAAALRPYPPDENYYKQVRGLPGLKELFIPTNDTNRLHAWLFNPRGSSTLVIVHHGNAGNVLHRLYLVSAILPCGAAVLLYDYRGYGKSTGTAKLSGLVEDGLNVYDFARTRLGFSPDHIVNFGESIGTGVACQLASMRPSAGLILQSAVGSLPRVAHARIPVLGLIPEAMFPAPHFDNVAQIKKVRVPVLMFHGTADGLVPVEHSRMIFANCSTPKQLILIPQAGHNDNPADSQDYRDALCRFLDSLGWRSGTQNQPR